MNSATVLSKEIWEPTRMIFIERSVNLISNYILRCIGKMESLAEFGLCEARKNLSSLRIEKVKQHFRARRHLKTSLKLIFVNKGEKTHTLRKIDYKLKMFAFRVTHFLMMVQNHSARWC